MSQRGDSGKNNIKKNYIIDGIAATPNINLQLDPQARQIKYAIN